MQLGLYLRGFEASSGVQSLRILEGYELRPSHSSEPPSAVHGESEVEKLTEAGESVVMA